MRSAAHTSLVFATLVAVGLGAAALTLTKPATAYDDDSAAVRANSGFKFGIGPVLLLPTDHGPLGGGLDLDLRYGIQAGPTILAPGGRLAGYFISDRFIGIAMPTFRLTVPLGPFAPFALAGVGGGWLSNPSEAGVALLGGGGLMIHFGSFFALGAEFSYAVITSTEFKELAFGPAIMFGL